MTSASGRGHRIAIDSVDGVREVRREVIDAVPSGDVFRWRPGDPHGFNVAEVVPARVTSQEVVVYPMSFDYRIDPLILRRLGVIAAAVQRRVLAVETPGVTMDYRDPEHTRPSTVSQYEILPAMRGDFTRLAELQLRALRETTAFDATKIRLLGESLGAQSVMSMTRSVSPLSIDLVEPVNCRPRSAVHLWWAGRTLAGAEEALRLQYVNRSKDKGWTIPTIFELTSASNARVDKNLKKFWSQGRWAVLSALGMAKGLVHEARSLPQSTRVCVWRGADSSACLPEDVAELLGALRARGVPAEMIEMELVGSPAGHHLLTDLDAAAGFGLELRRRWREGS